MSKVLIVDDAAFMRISIKNMLTKNGYDVVGEAENGAIGVEMYKDLHPDIVTMDITMPEMSGLDALKEINKIDPQAKVVMVSAMGQEAMVRELSCQGRRDLLSSPSKKRGSSRRSRSWAKPELASAPGSITPGGSGHTLSAHLLFRGVITARDTDENDMRAAGLSHPDTVVSLPNP